MTVADALAAGQSRAVITFQERAVVDDREIRLKDIATVSAADAKLRQRLEELRLGEAPDNGLRRLIPRRRALQAVALEGRDVTVSAAGALQTVVAARTGAYPGARLVEAAQAHLARHLRREHPAPTRLETKPLGEIADIPVPMDRKVSLEPRVQGSGLGKRVCVWVDVIVDGEAYRRVPVWLDVARYASVLVARRPLAPREPVGAADFLLAERDVAGVRGALVSDFNAVAGARTRHHVPAGALVRADDLEPAPAVLAEQEVAVRAAFGPVVIETRAVAEEEGRVGDYVRVRNPSSDATFVARVVGDQSVLVTGR